MPRRKGQGISPTKRTQAIKDGGLQTRKKAADSNVDPVGERAQQPPVNTTKPNLEESGDINNSKYLHKKFKKLATSSPTPAPHTPAHKTEEPAIPLEMFVNGLVKVQKEAISSEQRPGTVGEQQKETSDLAVDSGSKVNSTLKVKSADRAISPSGAVVLPSQGRYVCPYCKLACAKPSVLQKHIRAHTNERPYPCGPCGFAFKTKSNLYKHCRSRAHTLKMEEHGAKFSYPSEEPSDMEDEDDENNSNNTPPPPTTSFLGTIHTGSATVSLAPSQLSASTVLPAAVQVIDSAEKRSIYKPKFHKAAMYHEEEDFAHQTNKKGTSLSLKIPSPIVPSYTNVSSILCKTPSSPSSEFLQRHISKIISENQAIVETMDLWPKKHSRQKEKEGSPASPLSASTSPSLDPSSFPKTFFQRHMSHCESPDERIKVNHAAQSKLARALSRPNLPISPKLMECLPSIILDTSTYNQPLNLTTHHSKEETGVILQRKCSISETLGNILTKQGTILKDQNSLNNSTLNSKGRQSLDDVISEGLQNNADKFFHPQNPEGSIIKDLLLKARAASAAGLTLQGFQDLVDSEVGANTLPHLQAQEDFHGSQNAQYVCQLCKIPYRNAENLEIHQLYYCKGDGMKQSSSPQHSPNSKYGLSSREMQEEGSFASFSKSKAQTPKGKASFDLKISPVKDGNKICQPFPSPGPLLGSTPLVESYYYNKNQDDDYSRPQKKQRLDSENSSRSSPNSLHEVRSVSSPFAAMSTGGTTTLRSLEELSKCPMRPNSLQMFGGEVSILDGAGETKTMRIEPRGKSPGASEYLSLPNVHQTGVITKSESGDSRSNSSPHVVTIARSGLNSGGTIVQVPLKANAAPNLVKPPRSSGGSVNSRSGPSPISLSPMQRNLRHSVSSPPNTPFSTSTYFSHNTSTLTTSYPDTPKLMPNITTPNLAVPGIPAPSMNHHIPYLPFTSILPDGTLLNPLTNITAFNPLTLPPHSAILHANLLNLSAKDHISSDVSYPGVVTILHGGKVIPYVQGMPGPQTLMANSPNLGVRKPLSPKPLDLVSPSKEQLPNFKSDSSTHHANHQQIHFVKNKLQKSSNSNPGAKVIQSSHRKAPTKEILSPRNLTVKPSPVATTPSSASVAKAPVTIPSIKVDCISTSSDSSMEDIKRPPQSPRKWLKRSEQVANVCAKENVKEMEDDSLDTEVDRTKPGDSRAKFLRPTSLPLKPGTFIPKQHHGLTPIGGPPVLSLVSPETPRPKKSYGQLYLNGHSYTYLALKCSTRPFYCTLNRPQPMYVPQSPDHSKLSMYSNWKVCSEADPHPLGLDPGKAMAFYDSRLHRVAAYTVAKPSEKLPMTLTHSSYWVNKKLALPVSLAAARKGEKEDHKVCDQKEGGAIEGIEHLSLGESPPKRVKIFDGGFESNEDYIYVRGRGRGRYVCEECGIRCKKPSMLKKHIRTHTDVRPFTCKHCNFSFKTKGNLTKHMKSKAHYKKCVELGIVPVPTVVDDSYIDEECLARQQALRASRHSNGDTDSDENEEEEEEEDDEDEEDDDMGDDEGRLEREAACSLLSLAESTRFSSSTNHRYLSLGLIPLPSIIARPTTYPYALTFPAPKPNNQLTEPQTPTLINLTAQTENEKVSRNTGLALELREDTIGKVINTLNRRNSSNLVPPTGEKNRCYFPSRRTPTLVKSLSEKSWSDEDSDGYEYDNSEGFSSDSDMSDYERCRSERNDGGKSNRYEKNLVKSKEVDKEYNQLKELYEDKNIAKNLREILPEAHMKSLRELRESYEQSVGITPTDEVMDVDCVEQNSNGPMDLSNKSMSLTRKLSLTLPYYANVTNGTRTPTTPISDILTPVSEPAVLASLCSSMERFPVPQTLPAKLAIDVKETTMLQAYLTEKALQDVRVKQHQHRHNQGYTVSQSLIKVKDTWLRPSQKDEKPVQQASGKLVKKTQNDQESTDIPVSVLKIPKETLDNTSECMKQTEDIGNDRRSTDSPLKVSESANDSALEAPSISSPGNPESLAQQVLNVTDRSLEVEESVPSKTRDMTSGGESSVENALEAREGSKTQASESMTEKMVSVSIANSMARNVVVGGSAFAGHQPSSPPTSANDKKSPSPGKPKAEFMPPSIGPSSSYCSTMEDGRSVCVICNKIFSKQSQLRLHVNIHYFERPFRCESCAVSFRTKGHLQKHERSVSHQNKVSMNSTFGAATTTNPRPFKCDDCKIAFRIHGHLAKHLRSKMHIMKLECVGKLPFGTYAEMEREGVSLNDIDTSDCDNSLESLQILAQKLYEKDPSKLGQWDGERGELLNPNPIVSGGDSSSDEGEPCASPPMPSPHHSEFIPQELNFKNLSLRNTDVKSEQTPSPPPARLDLRSEYAGSSPGTRVISYADGPHAHLPYQLLGVLAPKGQLECPRVLSEEDHTAASQRCPRSASNIEYNSGTEMSRKRKSVDELDYTDTSDGDNEAVSNQKYPCGVCRQQFNTIALLHVHSFVEHDVSSTDEEKPPTSLMSKVPNVLTPAYLKALRKRSLAQDDPLNRKRITNADQSKQVGKEDTVEKFTTNQGSKNFSEEGKHSFQKSWSIIKKVVPGAGNCPVNEDSPDDNSNSDGLSINSDSKQATLGVTQNNTRDVTLENNFRKH